MTITGVPASILRTLIAFWLLVGTAALAWLGLRVLLALANKISGQLHLNQIVFGIYLRRLRRKKLAPNDRGMCAACFFEDTHQVAGVERVVDPMAHTCEIGEVTEPDLNQEFTRAQTIKPDGWFGAAPEMEIDDKTPVEPISTWKTTRPIILRPIRHATIKGTGTFIGKAR